MRQMAAYARGFQISPRIWIENLFRGYRRRKQNRRRRSEENNNNNIIVFLTPSHPRPLLQRSTR